VDIEVSVCARLKALFLSRRQILTNFGSVALRLQ